MENWDQQKLEEVVKQKHAEEAARPKTDIVNATTMVADCQGLQVFPRSTREAVVWLVLGLSQWRR